MNTDGTGPDGICDRVTACAGTVANAIGLGLPEVIYENALAYESRMAGLAVRQQEAVPICYDGVIVGNYTVDLLVENAVLVELMAVPRRNAFDSARCTRFLKATGLARSMLVNFGHPRLRIRHMKGGA